MGLLRFIRQHGSDQREAQIRAIEERYARRIARLEEMHALVMGLPPAGLREWTEETGGNYGPREEDTEETIAWVERYWERERRVDELLRMSFPDGLA